MRILITGNMGYVGPVVVEHLRQRFPSWELIGFDSGLFADCLTTAGSLPETLLNAQYFGDVRDFPAALLHGVDAVVHLAAVSNDPIGSRFETATEQINYRASANLASQAVAHGVRKFVFASSCSVYGAAPGDARRENAPLNPLTAYARSKVATEEALARMDLGGMTATCLRFATACGMSQRLRLDLVLNDFVACALTAGDITILSDGTPWRPLIDVRDMARAIEWAIVRDTDTGGRLLSVNVGADESNHRVRDMASAVAAVVPNVTVSTNPAAPADARSYRVDFSLFGRLAAQYRPRVGLTESINSIVDGLRAIGFSDRNFRHSPRTMRLQTVAERIRRREITSDLRWLWREAVRPSESMQAAMVS